MAANATPDAPHPSAAGRVASAAKIMVAAILLSRVLGLARDMVASYYFGAKVSPVADAYKSAFRLPDLLYYLIAGGALSTAFIPVFTEYLEAKDEENAWKVFSVFGTVIFIALCGLIIAGEVFTESLLTLLAPGFPPDKLALTASLTRIILPAQLCFFVGGLMMATLQVRNRFLIPALGPVVYNLMIIIGGVIGGVAYGSYYGIYGFAWGVVAGAIVSNVLMMLWEMRRVGCRYRPSLDIRHPGVVKVARLMAPVLLGLSLPQLHIILTTPFASRLDQGAVTWLDNANKVMQMPLGIFAQALSVAIFPTLSSLAARRDLPELRKHFSLGLRAILFLTIPSAALTFVLATPITALLFQRGNWTWDDTVATASATAIYSLAIFAVSGQQIVNRGFYAMQNTLTPMLIGTVATVGFIGLNAVLMGPLKTNGLALAYVITNAVTFGGLLAAYHRHIGGLPLVEIATSVGRVTLASAGLGAAAWGTATALQTALPAYGPTGVRLLPALLQIGLSTTVGGIAYLALVRLFKAPESEFVFGAAMRKLRRTRGTPTAEK